MTHERLVAYVSRTGTTAAAASWLAARLDADLHDLAPHRYLPDLLGLVRVAGDVLDLTQEPAHAPTLAGRRLVVLCAPIWFLDAAPPLRAFVRASRFRGADVLVVLTMTSLCSARTLRPLRADIVAADARCLGVHAVRVRPGDALPDLLTPLLSALHLP